MIDKDLLNYIKGKRRILVFIVLCSFLDLVCSVSSTFCLTKSVESYLSANYDIGTYYLLGSLALIVPFVLFYILKGKLANGLADYVSMKIRNDIYRKYVALNGKSTLKVQEIAQLSAEGIEQLRLYYSSYLPSFFYSMVAPISLFVLFCFLSYKVSLVYLLCVPLIPMSIIMVSKWAKKIFAVYWKKYLSLGGAYLDSVSGMKELLIFHYDKKMEEEMKKNSEEFRRITMKVLVMQLFSTTIMDLVAYGGASVGIVLTLLGLKNQEMTAQIAMFMVLVGAEFFLPMRALGSAFHVAMNGATAGKKVVAMLREANPKNGIEKTNTISNIELKDVSFRYPDSDMNTFQSINMVLKKGFTSLIGDSGCGKSTLSKILTRQLDGYEGKILVDSKELSSLDIQDYRKHVCYISNDTFLLHLSIRDGFRFYHPGLDEETMMSLLEEVSLKERIMDAGGLDYVPKEGASDLSGGEKQRLVLSYYLSTERDFYVFDETTSNIDKESEEIIVDRIHGLGKNHIVLFISHRLHNALSADQVYYFDKQEEKLLSGTTEELMKTCTSFMQNMENERRWEEIL